MMKLPLALAIAMALAAGPAAAQLKMPKGYKPPPARFEPAPKPPAAGKPRSAAGAEAPEAPGFKPWKPSKPASVFGPDGQKKRR